MHAEAGQIFDLRTGSWCGDRVERLRFPDHWRVTEFRGANAPAVPDEELSAGLFEPIEGPRLADLLSPDRSVSILIDDHSRPTPVARPLASILEFLRDAGVPAQRTTIVVAMGTHLLGDERLLRAKLGRVMDGDVDIVINDCDRARGLTSFGETDDGVPILVNRAFGQADVKITISGVYPHDDVGYSGGAKILMGAFGLATLSALHRKHRSVGRGVAVETAFRADIEAIADRIGLDYSINILLNHEKEITGVVSGPFRSAFRTAAVSVARDAGTRVHGDFDVVLSNAYPFDASVSVIGKSFWPFGCFQGAKFNVVMTSLCERGGGRIPWATTRSERWFQRLKAGLGLSQAKRLVRRWTDGLRGGAPGVDGRASRLVYAPAANGAGRNPRRVAGMPVYSSWDELVGFLDGQIASEHPRVALFPWAPLLYPLPD